MRPSTTLVRMAMCLGTMTSLAKAWPAWMEEMHLVQRQDDDSTDEADAQITAAPTATADDDNEDEEEDAEEDEDEEEEDSSGNQTTRILNTASTIDPDATATADTNSTTKEVFDDGNPAGGVTMITPDAFDGVPLYKAGDYVTWEWNYTNLLADPTGIDVLLSCETNSATYTLTANMSFETPARYIWDSSIQRDDSQQPLLTEEYTLIIKNSEVEISAAAEPGYLGSVETQLVDIYIPKAYTPFSEWNCPTCSAGPGDLDRQALGFAVSMCLLTIFSFTWFVTGLRL